MNTAVTLFSVHIVLGVWRMTSAVSGHGSLQHVPLMHMRAGIQWHDNSLCLNYCPHPSLALLPNWKAQRMVPSAGNASKMLNQTYSSMNEYLPPF